MPPGPPFSAQHILYQFTGTMPGGEIWSCGLRTAAATVTLSDLASYAAAVSGAFAGMWDATASFHAFNSAGVVYRECIARLISVAGLTLLQASGGVVNHPGNAPGQTAPNQTALVATLRTSAAGRRGKGRMYLPFVAPQFGTADDRVPSSAITPLATALASMITTINTVAIGATGPFPIVVQSRAGTPSAPPVTAIAVGDVVDTQRRRRDALRETYTVLAV